MAVAIFNGVIQVNQFRGNSPLNQGKNVENGWEHIAKGNFIVAQIAGNLNLNPSVANILLDPDLIDNNLPNVGGQSPNIGGNAEVL
ncbi:MAG: hypothetical protein K6T29_05105 [Peptococcaceae bacterium]|nr:hypothetical protein [Peptococcaceae bacterium]